MNLEINERFKECLDILLKTKENVFITGKAGSGKSTLLTLYREKIKNEKYVVLAPTGVAAVNIKGQTIHSFFKFKPDIDKERLRSLSNIHDEVYKELDTIIIDEISMVRSDLIDFVDIFLRKARSDDQPFGGVRMIFFGDLYQLPPVVTSGEREAFNKLYKSEYFFDSEVFKDFDFQFVELEKIYRQTDQKFIDFLNKVRNKSAKNEDIEYINERYQADLDKYDDDYYIHLTTRNDDAQEVNNERLDKLKTRSMSFSGRVTGDFSEKDMPTDFDLELKVDSQVMLINNDSQKRWFNGSIGKIIDFVDTDEEGEEINTLVKIRLDDGSIVEVEEYTWEMYKFKYDKSSASIVSETSGTFSQLPIKLAWAITIHKSQGKTFEKVIIDLGKGTFAHGQTYVALSRCRSFENTLIKRKVRLNDIKVDYRIPQYLSTLKRKKLNEGQNETEIERVLRDAIEDNKVVEMTYVKDTDETIQRKIKPMEIGLYEFMNAEYEALYAYCYTSGDYRTFKIDRIATIKVIEE